MCYLSSAPAEMLLCTLVHVGVLRWESETDFQESRVAKGRTNLEEYEAGRWQGRHHHYDNLGLAGPRTRAEPGARMLNQRSLITWAHFGWPSWQLLSQDTRTPDRLPYCLADAQHPNQLANRSHTKRRPTEHEQVSLQ